MDKGSDQKGFPMWKDRTRAILLASSVLVGSSCGDGSEPMIEPKPTAQQYIDKLTPESRQSMEDLLATLDSIDRDIFDSPGGEKVIVDGVEWRFGPDLMLEDFIWLKDSEKLDNPVSYRMDSTGVLTKIDVVDRRTDDGIYFDLNSVTTVESAEEINQLTRVAEQLSQETG